MNKLLALNRHDPPRVEVILLSRNTADTGLRIMNSIEHYRLDISRAAFTGGESTYPLCAGLRRAPVFLSANPDDVRKALDAGHAAATILPSNVGQNPALEGELRIAFDGDAVLFSDEAEKVYKRDGLEAFTTSETDAAREPLSGGPFKNFLAALHRIQSEYPPERSPIRTALVTARGAPAHERVIRTLRAWNIRIDEALFLGGLDKGPFSEGIRRRYFSTISRATANRPYARGNRACSVRCRQSKIKQDFSQPACSPGTSATAATTCPGRARAMPTASGSLKSCCSRPRSPR